ncbi:DEAD/DEAH box helicase [Novosphingobium sp. FSY-8]|uniref:DEAD/DEAH box helicase n=1 Tax=Novosphingobium ovatum TaxID=1908523 RepID=A0ABW9XAC2_9SPHN|nr:DEAD/DEAH box helicase [Novosphingobium ovatum]NBC35471.1 DEAD/DEAH box helicase [Novosphingobium ovatum]
MSYFSQLGLADPLLRALADKGYDDPTPIQRQSIPALIEGRDLLGLAQTGTGKTAAFALPSLHRLIATPKPRKSASCRMLVLSPTRELAAQIAENMRGYAKHVQMNIQCIFGGVPAGKQARALVPGCDILVATPGRLLDLIDQRALTLRDVEIFVLDEADQMMDLGFIQPLKRVARLLPPNRQSLFFSATMPQAIEELGKQFINNPVKVEVAPQATTAERVTQNAIFVSQAEKQALLTMTLRAGLAEGAQDPIDRAIIFTRTKHGADRVVRFLTPAGIEAAAIHGDKSQSQRTAALKGFRDGRIKVLVATDIAARGIDVSGVSHVFNFEIPNVAEQYVHRIGRTARAGADGIALSFIAEDERPYIRAIERLTGVKLTVLPLPANFLVEASRLPAPAKRMRGGVEVSDAPRQARGRNDRGGDRGGRNGEQRREKHRPGADRDGARPGARSHSQRDNDRARGERRDAQERARRGGSSFDPLAVNTEAAPRQARPNDARPAPRGDARPAPRGDARPAGQRDQRRDGGQDQRRDGGQRGPRQGQRRQG